MYRDVVDIEELSYEPKDVVEIMNDFRNIYSTLESKIKHFVQTQPTFLSELRRELKTEIGFLSPQKKDMALAIYGIIITEDILKKYEAQFYAEDISALLEATDKKQICTDDEFVGLLSSFINSIKTVTNSINYIIHHFIELSSLEIEEEIVKTILNVRNFIPAITESFLFFEVGEFAVDLRFIAATYAYALEKIMYDEHLSSSIKSTGQIYNEFINKYPPSDDENTLYDLINQLIISQYHEILQKAFQKTIEKRHQEFEEKTADVRKEFQGLDQRKIDQGRIEQFLSAIEQTLFETLKLRRETTETKRINLERNIEKVLRRMAIEEFGVQDIADQERYLQYLLDTWFSIFEEYPQMALPLIDIRLYAKFVSDPYEFIEENKQTIIQQLLFRIRRLTKGDRYTPSNLAYAFAVILFEFLTNTTVQSLSFEK
ncbi:MAG: hypothetical protein GOP50_09180 [Candidatus Heimdallarchaeota archaeon]|nr:hypothetical protein [Candidatus Heimdallarchaeota archaeon]